MKETDLVYSCIEYLAVMRIFAWRQNQGAMRMQRAGRKDRVIRFAAIDGISDIIGILPDGRFLAVECKVGRNKTSDTQNEFIEHVRKSGGVALVVYSLDDLVNALKGI